MDKTPTRNYSFATWLRATGVGLILLCHFTWQSGNPYLIMSSQFFNIGNDVFFILSGFLYGTRCGEYSDKNNWYWKRLLKIYVPYEMMLCFLLLVYLIQGRDVALIRWGIQFAGVQGWNAVYGTAQTWFVTSILICYLFTPLISEFVYHAKKKQISRNWLLCFLILFPIALAVFGNANSSSLFSPVCWYGISFLWGAEFDKNERTRKGVVVALLAMIGVFAARLICRFLFDGTIFYDRIVAGYSHALGAFCIFYVFSVLFDNVEPIKPIAFIAGISYEIYLWHYMFTDGPLRLFGLTPIWVINSIITLIVSVTIAYCAHKALNFIEIKVSAIRS